MRQKVRSKNLKYNFLRFDKEKNITHDNIHHHGWRLLTTGVISGKGYETITFERNSHLNKKNNHQLQYLNFQNIKKFVQ